MVEATREAGGKTTVERRYYLSSLPPGVEPFARARRARATLRRLALNLLKQEKTKRRGIKGRQLNAGRDHAHLPRLLGVEIEMRLP